MEKQQRGFKVLLVDDEDVFREATARQLSVRGFLVQTADSGETALEIVQSDPPEVVVLDQQMPGMNGGETFVEIKKVLIVFGGKNMENNTD